MADSAEQEQQLIAGWRAIERSDPGAAEAIAGRLLRQSPSHPGLGVLAYNLLAVSLMQQSRHEQALAALASALECDPRSAGTHLNLGAALTQLSRHAQALPYFKRATELEPQLSQAHNNLGHVLRELGRLDEAAESYRRAVRAAPDDFEAHNNLGVALDELDRHEEAVECFQKALALKPGYSDAYTNMGVAYQRMKRIDEAVEAHRKAISIAPGIAGSHLNLGLALREQGQLEAAAESFQRAALLNPSYADAHAQLGMIYRAQGRHEDAIACLRTAVSIEPGRVEALLHLGSACQERGRLAEAQGYFEKALVLDPGSADAHHNLGVVLQGLSRHDEAIACFQEALRRAPAHRYTAGALLWSELMTCRWDALDSRVADLKARIRSGETATEPFVLVAVSEDLEELRRCAVRFCEHRIEIGQARLWTGEPYAHSRIRIAYLSADFREHAVAHCIAPLIEIHDRSRFEVIGCSLGADDGSAMRSRLARGFDRFLDLRSAGDLEVARLLREAEVDIAVDLTGHTQGSRLGVLAHRPAPIQVGYLGFAGTTGADFVDYLIADRFVIPEQNRPFYSEQIAFLPDSYMVNHSQRVLAEPLPRRVEVGLPEDAFVFCSFNNSYKISPRVFEVWMRLLSKNADSVLWLAQGNPVAEANLQKEAARRGVDPRRLVFAPFAKRIEDHYARLCLADLFLDTAYNGHVTATDALWSGLPVLTCAGKVFAGRVAGGLLHCIGLPELVTHDLEEYEAVALRLARDRGFLKELRARLEANKRSAPLFDTERFRRHIESAYMIMREISRRGEPPRTFEVERLP